MIAATETTKRVQPRESTERVEPTDEQLLLEYCRTGDRRLFSQLTQRYQREVYNYLRRFMGNAESAEDAFQATFLQVHLKCHRFEEDRRFRPWLYAIATNCAIDLQRRNKRHSRTFSLDTGLSESSDEGMKLTDLLVSREPNPADELDRAERGRWVRESVMQLSDSLRAVVDLIYYQGMKYSDAAETLGIPVGTVKSRMNTAIHRLAEAWQQAGAASPLVSD